MRTGDSVLLVAHCCRPAPDGMDRDHHNGTPQSLMAVAWEFSTPRPAPRRSAWTHCCGLSLKSGACLTMCPLGQLGERGRRRESRCRTICSRNGRRRLRRLRVCGDYAPLTPCRSTHVENYNVDPFKLLSSPEYRFLAWSFLTASPRAFRCPTTTSRRLARVMPV